MLDGRVLGASQVEYKPFGKPPLKREIQHKWHQFNTSATCACVHIPVAPPARQSLPGIGAARQPAESYGSYGSYGHTVIRRLGTAPPCRACLA